MERAYQRLSSFISWSERLLRTDVRYLISGGFWLATATVANTAISLLLLYAFGNFVTPEVYGEYKFFFSIYGILTLTSLAGFNGAVVRASAKGNDGDLMAGFKLQVAGSLVGSIGAFIGSAYYFLNDNPTLGNGLLIMGLAMPLMESLDLYSAFLNGKRLFKETAIASITSQSAVTLALIIAIVRHERVLPLLTTYFATWILMKGVFFFRARKLVQNDAHGTDLFSTGMNFSVIGILNTIASNLDKIALFHFIGAKEVALYSFAIAPTEQIKALFKNANALIFPKFSLRSEEELRQTIARKSFLVAGISLGIALLYILSAPFIIKLLIPKYQEIVLHSQLYALSLVGVMVIPVTVAMNAIPKIRALYFINTTGPLVNIALIALLIPHYGLWGAIAAKAIGRFINIGLTFFAFQKI